MVTRQQIEWAYRVILGRAPESEIEYVWHLQHSDFDELRRNIVCSDEGSGVLRRMLGPVEGQQPFDSILQEPAGGVVKSRISKFAGFVQSSEPLPPIRIIFDARSQVWVRTWSTYDMHAPWTRRFTTHWSFQTEVPVESALSKRKIVLEVFSGSKLVGVHPVLPRRAGLAHLKRRPPLVYFIHVEKTAGTSMRSMLARGKLATLFVYNHIDFLPEELCRRFTRGAFNDLDVVFGHFPFGFHRSFEREHTYASIIRRPLDLVKSYYLFVKYVSDEEKFDGCADIYDAIENVGDRVFDNILVRYFSGNFDAAAVGEADYKAAVENIDKHFSFIGLSEAFEVCASTLCARLRTPYSHVRENTTPSSDEETTIDLTSLASFLGDRVAWDMRLYDRVAARWNGAHAGR